MQPSSFVDVYSKSPEVKLDKGTGGREGSIYLTKKGALSEFGNEPVKANNHVIEFGRSVCEGIPIKPPFW